MLSIPNDVLLQNLTFILIFGSLSFVVAMVLTPIFIRFLERNSLGQQIRDSSVDGKVSTIFRELHLKKSGTPTMGGVIIWGTVVTMVLLSLIPQQLGWVNYSLWNRAETYIPLFTLVAAGLLGMLDDWWNIKGVGKQKGLRVKPKLIWLTVFAAGGAWWFFAKLGCLDGVAEECLIHLPRLGDFNIGLWYLPLFILVILSSANAVNITDGLDGLAGGLLAIAFGSFGVIAFFQGMFLLATLCAAIVGALVAFLWWNVPPAKFFMGDTGSYSLGATLGVIAMLTDSIIPFLLIGAVFILETLSVIIQLVSKKFWGRKIFLIAPLHHHFEKLGWPESQIVMRFWLIGGITAGLGLVLGIVGMGN
ncbi:phospho-N-acetylmuramoyl-pentapeptide-transferase [Candidatus Gracilibacteria bacterium]|nr:phospho-N-acetylmuramoyl-pentapeptide-transferase [Candidatus Gracilibacteria bacterium]MCF7856446.1 phospho-N-acetylmuramoyl-pentapeptide-transferase [Candidatus Gracilibacteria bacterium]MCF7896559.1 phospho-N-acetylmuramoyl-pentapeptide-transferase [Candidatus Gracilibacteria bacterium]